MIPLRVLSARGRQSTEIQAVVDTGFTGFLTLPTSAIRTLALPLRGSRDVVLADGSVTDLDVYRARVIWHGLERPVSVLESDGDALVGMSLLLGSRLTVDVVPGGSVVVEEHLL